jgi:hypothetical protein
VAKHKRLECGWRRKKKKKKKPNGLRLVRLWLNYIRGGRKTPVTDVCWQSSSNPLDLSVSHFFCIFCFFLVVFLLTVKRG